MTAGNASPLTDGAAAVLLMSEDAGASRGATSPSPSSALVAVGAVDPAWQALPGPGLAIPLALDQAGVALSEMGLVEMHEAFAAQVLSNLQALASPSFAREHLGRSTLPWARSTASRLNVCGGSIALGHPFGATGARVVLGLAREMQRRDVRLGLASICAQGGMGFALVMER